MSWIRCFHVLFILWPEGVSGDLSHFSVQKGQGTCRVTAVVPPMNIRGGAPFFFTNSSVTMSFAISAIISTKQSSAEIYGSCVHGRDRGPWLLSTIDNSNGPQNSNEGWVVYWSSRQMTDPNSMASARRPRFRPQSRDTMPTETSVGGECPWRQYKAAPAASTESAVSLAFGTRM